jgi:hypothetical protein
MQVNMYAVFPLLNDTNLVLFGLAVDVYSLCFRSQIP